MIVRGGSLSAVPSTATWKYQPAYSLSLDCTHPFPSLGLWPAPHNDPPVRPSGPSDRAVGLGKALHTRDSRGDWCLSPSQRQQQNL